MSRIVQKILAFLYVCFQIPKVLIDNKRKNEQVVYWIKAFSLKNLRGYFRESDMLQDVAVLQVLVRNYRVKVVVGNTIDKVKDSKIVYSISKSMSKDGRDNYNMLLQQKLAKLSANGNIICPSGHVLNFWENKIHMHEVFEKLGVRTPETEILVPGNRISNARLRLASELLLKLPHSSGSNGLFRFYSEDELYDWFRNNDGLVGSSVIIQERLNMSFDIRIVVNDFKVKSHYWRINPDSNVWHPTSTSRGSSLSYKPLPCHVITYLEKVSRELDLAFCAYDVAFNNDDIESDPLILEVSSHYQMNPKFLKSGTYKNYKKKVFGKNPYWREYVKIQMNEIRLQYENYVGKI